MNQLLKRRGYKQKGITRILKLVRQILLSPYNLFWVNQPVPIRIIISYFKCNAVASSQQHEL